MITRSRRKQDLFVAAGRLALLAALGVGPLLVRTARGAETRKVVQAPRFEVDPLWPKPLPDHWLLGSTVGVSVDAEDHVWIVHHPATLNATTETGASANPPIAECCVSGPQVLEFDPAGTVVRHWGGPGQGYEWPESNHGITVDYKGNVWLGAWGPKDAHILKFTREGQLLMQVGHQGKSAGSNDRENFGRATKIWVDPKTNEAFVADGYRNRRVVVIDADTGAFKRYWGAYGNKPDDTDPGPYDPAAPVAQQFRTPVHCVAVSDDDLVYVCDRRNTRIQVFRKDGTFVKEGFIAKNTLGDGSVWDVAFSRDPQQKYLYVADGTNEKIHVLDRDTLEELTSFGDGGRQPGQFFGVHNIATDSKGNIYTTETYEGKRLQRFVYKGLGPVAKKDQGAPWPASARE
jgi:DNA-binding beta-propeller fold protein YncE